MNRAFLVLSLLSVLIIATLVFAEKRSTAPQEPERTEWEYLVIVGGRQSLSSSGGNGKMSKLSLDSGFRENYPLEMNLDKLGEQGWELVTVVATSSEPIYYLKRAKEANK